MGRFQNSLALAKASWRVLREDQQLTLLPLLSMVATVVIAVSFLLPIGLIARNGTDGYTASKPLVWVLGFCAYLVLTFVVVRLGVTQAPPQGDDGSIPRLVADVIAALH